MESHNVLWNTIKKWHQSALTRTIGARKLIVNHVIVVSEAII